MIAHTIRIFTAAERPIQLSSLRVRDRAPEQATAEALGIAREHGLAHTRLEYVDERGRILTSKLLPVDRAE